VTLAFSCWLAFIVAANILVVLADLSLVAHICWVAIVSVGAVCVAKVLAP
jgi:hypothetical protein